MTAGRGDLQTHVHLVPLDEAPVVPDAVADQLDSQRPPAERLRDPHPASPLALLVWISVVNSSDRVSVVAASINGRRFDVVLDVRRFSGPLFANLQFLAVLELGPISLDPGPVEVDLTLVTRLFEAIDRPEDATAPSTSSTLVIAHVPELPLP